MQRTSDWNFLVAKWSFFEIVCNRDNWLQLFEVSLILLQRCSQNSLAKTWKLWFNVMHGPFEAPVWRTGNNSRKLSWIWERRKVWRSSVLRSIIFSVESAYFLMESVEIFVESQVCWIFWCQHQPLSEDSDSIPNFAKSLASRWCFFCCVQFFKRLNMKMVVFGFEAFCVMFSTLWYARFLASFGCQCDLSNVESSGVQPAWKCPNMPCHHGLPRLAEVFNKLEGRVGHRKALPKRFFLLDELNRCSDAVERVLSTHIILMLSFVTGLGVLGTWVVHQEEEGNPLRGVSRADVLFFGGRKHHWQSKKKKKKKKRNTFFVVRPFEGSKTLCGEISGDDRPGDSSDEGATMAFFWMTFFSAPKRVSFGGASRFACLVTPLQWL